MKRALIFLVVLTGLTIAQGSLDLMLTLQGPSPNFGRAVISGQDINGGGMSDIVVGSYTEDAVYIYFGESLDDVPDMVFKGENSGDNFGYALSFCGDLNSDGNPELVVGAPYWNSQVGKVYVYYGGPSIDTTADFTLQSPTNTAEWFGFSIACGGCWSTYPDIIVGAPNYFFDNKYVGRVYFFRDPGYWPDTLVFQGQGTWDYDYFGYSLATGRMNGYADVFDDLLVGCPYAGIYEGRAYLFLGGAPMDTTPDLIWYGTPGSTDFLAYSVACIHDIDYSIPGDLAIGIPYRNGAGSARGEVYVIHSKSPQDTTPDIILRGDNQDYAYFGACVNHVRDINLDNWWDLMVAATNYNNGVGKVYLYLTASAPYDSIYDAYADAPDAYSLFGASIAGCRDLNGDNYGDIVVGSDGASSKAYVYAGRSDFMPPVIDSVTQINDTAFTGPFVISARARDPNGSILADSIYCNVNGTGYTAAGHDSMTGNKYYFHIPQQAPPSYVPTVVQWYLMFYDGANYAYAPLPGPADPFHFNILDLEGPDITGTTLWPDTNFTGPYLITCNATDNSGVAWVKLHWTTTDGQNNWMPMFSTGVPNQYSASIQTQNLNKLISYYIEATDSFQIPNYGYSPKDHPTRYAFCLGQVPQILLVDADNGDTNEYYYKKILDSLRFPYVLWPDSWGKPRYAFESRDKFKILLWFTSLATTSILIPEDQDSLISFFNRGGKLFISSQNLGEEIGDTPFYQDWLHARFDQPAFSVLLARAVPGDSVSDIYKDTIATYGATGAGNAVSKDRIFPDTYADSCYVCKDSGGCYAIKYAADSANGYRLVYFSVPFEAINHSPSLYAQRHPIMVSILKWFGMQYSAEEQKPLATGLKFALGPIVPNPFTRATKITYSLPASQEISLKIYDMSGRLVNILAKGRTQAGIYNITWNGKDANNRKVSSGVYFLVLQNSEKRLDEKVIFLR